MQIICDCILFEVKALSKTDIYSILYRIYNDNCKSSDMFFYLKNRNIIFKIKYRYIKDISLIKNIFLFRNIYLPLLLRK